MSDLLDQIKSFEEAARRAIEDSRTLEDLENARVRYLGRKGALRALISQVGSESPDIKRQAGEHLNRVKRQLAGLIDSRAEILRASSAADTSDYLDVTAPGAPPSIGRIHPITLTIREISDVFARMGFTVRVGPEIETEYYNFEALNIPEDHPSRDGFDTFYVFDPDSLNRGADGQTPPRRPARETHLLRSHTSPVQIRVMETERPPLRIIVPGRTFRPDTADASHYPVFHQVEGLMVGEDVSLADLKAVLAIFAREFFGPETRMRFRPSFFPFTEPSAEVDISCIICGGKGCPVCKGQGWLEILGSGMVHPEVLRAVGYDSEKYTGFAFGMGVERIAMLKYRIDDIRLFFENDIRFLRQF